MTRIVYADGVFDLLHVNHVALLEHARSLGDRLVVGVVTDAAAASYKRAPVIPEQERLRMVLALRAVDDAFLLDGPFDRACMLRVMAAHGPFAAVVYGGGAFADFYAPAVEQGIMHATQYRPGVSTSSIIETIHKRSENRLSA